MFGGTVFLSQYFQISLGKSPTVAGLMSLPMIFGLLVSSTVAGQLITKYGKWKIYLVAGARRDDRRACCCWARSTPTPACSLLSVYMAVLGVGVGMLMQNLVLAAQNDVPAHELGATTSVLTFFRSMGGAIGVSALGAVLANRITALMRRAARPGGRRRRRHRRCPTWPRCPSRCCAIIAGGVRHRHRRPVPGRRADRGCSR